MSHNPNMLNSMNYAQPPMQQSYIEPPRVQQSYDENLFHCRCGNIVYANQLGDHIYNCPTMRNQYVLFFNQINDTINAQETPQEKANILAIFNFFKEDINQKINNAP